MKTLSEPAKFGQTPYFCGFVFVTRPGKFVALDPLLPQAKSVSMTVQCVDPVVMAVGKIVQRAGNRVQPQFLLDQHAQGVYGF